MDTGFMNKVQQVEADAAQIIENAKAAIEKKRAATLQTLKEAREQKLETMREAFVTTLAEKQAAVKQDYVSALASNKKENEDKERELGSKLDGMMGQIGDYFVHNILG